MLCCSLSKGLPGGQVQWHSISWGTDSGSGLCDWSILSSVRARGGRGICKECGWYPEPLVESSGRWI